MRVSAAQVRVREAQDDLGASNWMMRLPARRRLALAEQELAFLEASVAAATARTDVGGLP
ncbi:hypothetical protein [Agromyces ramosus]|uniref:Uncharacterized protein n=1 Tax=Agromyces ramosus TaxID=33879 RepID=A0ABU0RB99_9MICO|nr:hypothetical protein [Agromyces ramosus]MDQ0895354.1 hypothetical protein [Agromyces ramosus]